VASDLERNEQLVRRVVDEAIKNANLAVIDAVCRQRPTTSATLGSSSTTRIRSTDTGASRACGRGSKLGPGKAIMAGGHSERRRERPIRSHRDPSRSGP
jgi:hypothetical protein